MITCEACGTENPPSKSFCSNCGQVLPASKGRNTKQTRNNFDQFTDKAGDFFENVFRKSQKQRSSNPARETAPPQNQQNYSKKTSQTDNTSDAKNPSSAIKKAEVLTEVAKTASKAIIKSIALSLAVLGPGFLMLMMASLFPE